MIGPTIDEEAKAIVRDFEGEFSRRRILVTGGAGFIGSWICDVLVHAKGKVDCLDNFSTGKMDNIEYLGGRIRLIRTDVENAELSERYDYILHLSSRASPEEYQQHPIETLTANSVGTLKILEHARKYGSIVLFASTSEVYGDAQVVPTPETYFGNVNPIGMRSCYDEGKRFAEALCMAYFRENRVKVRIARIFNSYGPRIREDGLYARALPRFVKQALAGDPITIYGDGKQTRSFCYITDTVRGMLKLATQEGLDGEVFNIGNTKEIPILGLARMTVRMTRSRSAIKFMPSAQDDPRRRCPDITKAKRFLGWAPRVDLESGLARLIASRKTDERQKAAR